MPAGPSWLGFHWNRGADCTGSRPNADREGHAVEERTNEGARSRWWRLAGLAAGGVIAGAGHALGAWLIEQWADWLR
jgi:hypothetical protein